MRQTVSTILPTPDDADRATRDLMDAGVSRDAISVIPDGVAPENDPITRVHGDPLGRIQQRGEVSAKRGALLGLVVGGVLGAALGFVGSWIPMTVGTLTAVGWGLGLGGAAGLVSGMTLNSNLPSVLHDAYPRPEVEGHTVVRVDVPEQRVDQVWRTLEDHGAIGFDRYAERHDARRRVARETGDTMRGVAG